MTAQRRSGDRQDGAVTVILLLLTGMLFALAGLVWDGGRAITARQHAADLAAQAARAGAQDIDLTALRSDGVDVLDAGLAVADACRYVHVAAPGAGCTATATPTSVTVVVTTRTPTALLGLIGITTFTTHGSATATGVRGVVTGEVDP